MSIEVVCSVGNVGAVVSATFSPLKRCDNVDVGDHVRRELAPIVTLDGVPVLYEGKQVIYLKDYNG